MSEKKQLNDEELEKINGGWGSPDNKTIEHVIRGQQINIYQTAQYIGQDIYVELHPKKLGKQEYYAGNLLKSWEGPCHRCIDLLVKYKRTTDEWKKYNPAHKETLKLINHDSADDYSHKDDSRIWLVTGWK